MIIIEHTFTLIGAVTVIVLAVKAARQLRKDLRSKPTPWLGMKWGL